MLVRISLLSQHDLLWTESDIPLAYRFQYKAFTDKVQSAVVATRGKQTSKTATSAPGLPIDQRPSKLVIFVQEQNKVGEWMYVNFSDNGADLVLAKSAFNEYTST